MSRNLKLGSDVYTPDQLQEGGLYEAADQSAQEVHTQQAPIQPTELNFIPMDRQVELMEQNQRDEMGPLETMGAAFQQEWVLAWGFKGMSDDVYDPDFELTEEKIQQLGEGIDPMYWDYFEDARSESHAQTLRNNLLDALRAEEDINNEGMFGLGARLTAAVLDPVGWGTAAFGGQIGIGAQAGRKLTRLQRAIRGGTGAAVATGMTELGLQHYKPNGEYIDVLYATGLGFGLGGALGALTKNAPIEADAMARVGRDMMQEAEEQAARLEPDLADSAGAMRAPDEIVLNEQGERMTRAIQRNEDELAPLTAFAQWRFDVSGRLKGSSNPLTRALGNMLGEDAVGNANRGVATRIAITEDKELIRRRFENAFKKPHTQLFRQYWKSVRGARWNPLARNRALADFNRSVTQYIRRSEGVAPGEFHPAVVMFGDRVKSLFNEYKTLANRPGMDEMGEAYGSVKGFDNIEDFAENYVPRMWDSRAFGEMAERFRPDQIRDLFAAAIKRGTPDILDEDAAKVGEALYKTLARVEAGSGVDGVRVLTSGDDAAIREFLTTHVPDMPPSAIDDFIETMSFRQRKGGPSEGKRRIQLDETFKMRMKNSNYDEETIGIEDFFVNDIEQLFSGYNRHMAGWTALAKMRLRDPDTGEILLDGIRSRGEWGTLMDRVRETSTNKAANDADVTRMEFLFRQITGTPEPGELSNLAQGARMVRDYNFMRLMGQVGFAQVAEMGVLVSNLGVKATFKAFPTLRTMKRDVMSGEFTDELAEELDYMTAPGTEWLRGEVHQKWDEFNNAPTTLPGQNRFLNRLDMGLQHGKRAVSGVSGMAAVNALMQRWTARGFAMRFAEMARGKGGFTEARLRSMSLRSDEVEAIMEQFRKHAQYTERGTLQRMNLRQWDPYVANRFEQAAFRFGRRVIQENDPGQMAAIMGNWFARTVLQFRTFVIGAYTKQLLHNVHVAGASKVDAITTGAVFAGSSLAASISYMAQTHLQAVGREDRNEFLEERLSGDSIAKAAFQRAGWASFLPVIADGGLAALGQDTQFSYRSSGLGIFDNPTFDLGGAALEGVGGIADSFIDGREASQQELKAITRVGPFQNTLPAAMMFNLMLDEGRPERAPRD